MSKGKSLWDLAKEAEKLLPPEDPNKEPVHRFEYSRQTAPGKFEIRLLEDTDYEKLQEKIESMRAGGDPGELIGHQEYETNDPYEKRPPPPAEASEASLLPDEMRKRKGMNSEECVMEDIPDEFQASYKQVKFIEYLQVERWPKTMRIRINPSRISSEQANHVISNLQSKNDLTFELYQAHMISKGWAQTSHDLF